MGKQKNSFDTLVDLLCQEPLLQYSDFTKPRYDRRFKLCDRRNLEPRRSGKGSIDRIYIQTPASDWTKLFDIDSEISRFNARISHSFFKSTSHTHRWNRSIPFIPEVKSLIRKRNAARSNFQHTNNPYFRLLRNMLSQKIHNLLHQNLWMEQTPRKIRKSQNLGSLLLELLQILFQEKITFPSFGWLQQIRSCPRWHKQSKPNGWHFPKNSPKFI